MARAKSKVDESQVNKPFEPDVLRRAQEIAQQLSLIIEPDQDGGFLCSGVELPAVFADGPDAASCAASGYEALTGAVAVLLEQGQEPPKPLTNGQKTRLNDYARSGMKGGRTERIQEVLVKLFLSYRRHDRDPKTMIQMSLADEKPIWDIEDCVIDYLNGLIAFQPKLTAKEVVQHLTTLSDEMQSHIEALLAEIKEKCQLTPAQFAKYNA